MLPGISRVPTKKSKVSRCHIPESQMPNSKSVAWKLCFGRWAVWQEKSAEYQRAYVERIKSDPQQHEEYKRRIGKGGREERRMHLMRNWSSEEHTRESENDFNVRKRQSYWKSKFLHRTTDLKVWYPLIWVGMRFKIFLILGAKRYVTSQSAGKAMAKTRKSLATSSRRRVYVVRSLAKECGIGVSFCNDFGILFLEKY